MAYGELKVDSITFTNGGTDTTVSVSGLVQNPTFSGDITVTGTISGSVVQGGTTVSGATVTGSAGQFGTVSGNTAGFTTVTGTTVTGTTANFASGVFTSLSGTTATVTSGVFASGTAAAPSVSVGTTDNGLYSPGTDQLAISTNGTGRLFVDASGNVGVGIDTPTANLHVKSNVNPAIRIEDQGEYLDISYNDNSSTLSVGVINADNSNTSVADTELRIGVDGASRYVTKTDGSHTFYQTNGSTESLKITSDGKVGLGTSSPNVSLHVNSPGNTTLEISSTFSNSSSTGLIIDTTGDSSSARILFQKAGVQRGTMRFSHSATGNEQFSINIGGGAEELVITAAGNIGIGTTSPSSLLHLADAGDITVGTTTGTKIGTATSQKIGFYDATPVVQPTTGVAEAAFVENSGGTAVNVDSTFGGYTIQQVVEALQTLGLLA